MLSPEKEKFKHWIVAKDGALIHKKTGYDITLNWIIGLYGNLPPAEHISHKIWATPEVIEELNIYTEEILRISKLN
jgi:hypothetical protein